MNLMHCFLTLRMRAKLIMLFLLITVTTALIVTVLMPNKYKATTTLVLNYKGTDALTGSALPGQMVSGYLLTYIATQIDIIKSITVATKVVDQLKLYDVPSVRAEYEKATHGKSNIREWIAQSILRRLEVKPSRESSVIEITFIDSNPALAAAIANTFVDAYQKTTVALDATPLKNASVYFNDQLKPLRENLEATQSKVSEYQKANGIVTADNRTDVENARLNELSGQLVIAQSQLMEASSRRNQVQGTLASESPDVASNPLVQSLRADLSKAEIRFSMLEEKFGSGHLFYREAQAEIVKLRSELALQIALISKTVSSNARILERREADLRALVAEQKTKVLDLNRKRDELSLLSKEMESAQRTFEAVSQRLAQTRIQAQANQSDVAVLAAASVPRVSTGLAPWLILLLSAVAGLLMGCGVALLREFFDRRVRSGQDLEMISGIPMLATLETIGAKAFNAAEYRLLPWQPNTNMA